MVFMANKLDLIVKILSMNYKFFGYLLIAFIFQFSEIYSQDIKFKKELISKMLDSIDSHNQISFEMFRSERTLKGIMLMVNSLQSYKLNLIKYMLK